MRSQFQTFGEMIKISHTVFALPFALIAMLLAAQSFLGFWSFLWHLILVCVAVFCARTAAMTFNRIVDRDIDRDNPRTKNRALVTGELSTETAKNILLASYFGFIFTAFLLNWLAFWLSFPCLIVLLGYSLMKRVTNWVHLVLGFALGLAPVGAWVAVRGEISLLPLLLTLAITLWVAGFDILYACQDFESDKKDPRVHSIPKRVGLKKAMTLAKVLHGGSLLVFFLFWLMASGLGFFFFLGLLATGGLLYWQHSIISPKDISRIDAAFFSANGWISMTLLAMTFLDVVIF